MQAAPWSGEGPWSSESWHAGDVSIPVPSLINGRQASNSASGASSVGKSYGDAFPETLRSVLSTVEETLLHEHQRLLRLQEHVIHHKFAKEAGLPCRTDACEVPPQVFAEIGTQTRVDHGGEPIVAMEFQPGKAEIRPRSQTSLDKQRSRGTFDKSMSSVSAVSGFTENHIVFSEMSAKSVETTKSKLVEILQRQDDLGAAGGEVGRHGNWRMLATATTRGWAVDQLMGIVIMVNTLLIGISCDFAKGWNGWLVLDIVFASIFVAELVFKVCTFGVREVFCGYDRRWGWFEMFLALAAWIEILLISILKSQAASSYNISVFRVVRLFRITRVIQVVRFQIFGDLLMMIQGALGSLRTLMWSAVLITCPVYAIALFMRETLGSVSNPGAGATHFTSLGGSLFMVFRCLVASDCTDDEGLPVFVLISRSHGWGYGLLYMIAYTFMTFGLFNVIVAIYVENTVAAAKYNEVYMKRGRLNDQKLLAEKSAILVRLVWEIFQEYGCEEDKISFVLPAKPTAKEISDLASEMQITPDLFEHLRSHHRFQEVLTELDVSDEDQLDLFETLDFDGSGNIDLQELILGISKLRGDARRADIVGISLMVRSVQRMLLDFEARVGASLEAQDRKLRAMASGGRPGTKRRTDPTLEESFGRADPTVEASLERTDHTFEASLEGSSRQPPPTEG